jgi:type II secretory pathway pseudopilin PulG
MSLSTKPHHKICGSASLRPRTASSTDPTIERPSEAGYTLVALLAVMTLLALFAMAAAPSIRQQAQREREKEAIFRGEEIADAIRSYYLNRVTTRGTLGDQALPSSMDQLLEGIPIPGGAKNRQILRASAARDPLSASGEWRFIHPRSQALIDFERSVMVYSGNLLPSPKNNPQMLQLQQLAAPQIINVINTEGSQPSSGESDSADDSSGPFVGVASRSKNDAVLYYYGIDHHNEWIFTPLFRN